MALKIKVRDQEFNKQLANATQQGLIRAAVYYWTRCKTAVSVPNSGVPGPSGRTVYPDPSKPGEPPRLRTGFGRDNIVWESNDSQSDPRVRVGSTKNGIYMIYLELGTRRIAPRPWLVATLLKFKQAIGQLAVTGGKGQTK